MSAERRQQRFYEGGQDYLERRRESARLSRAGGVAAAADSEDGPVSEDQVHMVPSLLRIGTSDGAYDAIDDLVEEDDESEDDSGMEEMVEDSSDDCMSDNEDDSDCQRRPPAAHERWMRTRRSQGTSGHDS